LLNKEYIMLLSIVLILGSGALLGALGGITGKYILARWFGCSITHRPDLMTTYLRRSLAAGVFATASLALSTNVGGSLVLLFSVAGFLAALLYVSTWLQLATKLGVGTAQMIELSVLAAVVFLSLLYMSGVLWITLAVVGVCVAIAVSMIGGMLAYRRR
jgi:hypothetical protein